MFAVQQSGRSQAGPQSHPRTSRSAGLQYNIHLDSFTTYQASTCILIHSYILINNRKIQMHSHAHTTQRTFSTGHTYTHTSYIHTYIHTYYIHTYSDLVSSLTYSTYLIICCIGQSLSVSYAGPGSTGPSIRNGYEGLADHI